MGKPAEITSDIYAVGAILYELLTGEAAEPCRDGWSIDAPSTKNPELGPEHDAVVAMLLADKPSGRPADAFDARRMLSSLRWPEKVPPAWLSRTNSDVPARKTEDERLGPPAQLGDGRDMASLRHDEWLDREVLVLPLDDDTLLRARGFARAGHPGLPTVLRVDRAAQQIWVAPPLGKALADAPRWITRGAFERFVQAIEALRAAGGAHGYIDPQHVYWFDGELQVAWPRKPVSAEAAANDEAALEKLAKQVDESLS
jgi:serine/threonine-protein kinase